MFLLFSLLFFLVLLTHTHTSAYIDRYTKFVLVILSVTQPVGLVGLFSQLLHVTTIFKASPAPTKMEKTTTTTITAIVTLIKNNNNIHPYIHITIITSHQKKKSNHTYKFLKTRLLAHINISFVVAVVVFSFFSHFMVNLL